MLSNQVANYNYRLVRRTQTVLEANGISNSNVVPLKIMIIKHVKDDSYASVSVSILKCKHGSDYYQTIRCYDYYKKIVLNKSMNSRYYICKLDDGRFYYVDKGYIETKCTCNDIFDIDIIPYEEFMEMCEKSATVLDLNINYLGTINLGNEYDFIIKYSAIIKYVLITYKRSNELCLNLNLRSEVNGLMKAYRGNWRNWEFVWLRKSQKQPILGNRSFAI